MSAFDWYTDGQPRRLAALRGRKLRHESRTRVKPTLEGLEPIWLLSTTACTISGYVFYDGAVNGTAPSNDGLFEPTAGEYGLAGANVQLVNSAGDVIAQTTTESGSTTTPNNPNDPNLGFYQFNLSTPGGTQTITQTLTIPGGSQLTDFSNLQLLDNGQPLQLFNPAARYP